MWLEINVEHSKSITMSEELKPEVINEETPDVDIKQKFSNLKEKVAGKFQELKENAAEAKDLVAEKVMATSEKIADTAAEVKEKLADKVEETKETAAEVKDKMAGKVKEVAETVADVKDQMVEKVEEVGDIVSDKMEEVGDKVSGKVDDLKKKASEVKETASEKAEDIKEKASDKAQDAKEAVLNFGDKTLSELSVLFQNLAESADRMKRSKEAEAIKSAFYKKLGKEKAEAGEEGPLDEPSGVDAEVDEAAVTAPLAEIPAEAEVPAAEEAPAKKEESNAENVVKSAFAAIEEGFKALYNKYKQERAAYNREQDARKEENLQVKLGLIEELKALIEEGGEMKDAFPKFREIQNRWRETGPVPQTRFRDVNDTYQVNVEKFYDIVQINRDLRDLDFKKNLEAKTAFCEQAEKLAESDNSVESFKELQKLHEQWKEYGPVAKEYRDSIWERFRAATAVINKKYQAHFEGLKDQQVANLQAKTALCEKVEEIAAREITSSNQWNALSKEIENIQAEWRKIGFATRKENQKIYERFRAACDAFFARKGEYYNSFKESMTDNMDRKMAIIEEAESLKDSKDWKATGDRLIELQKMWKEIGAVPRKKSEQLWKRFRAACDAFFDARDKSEDRPKNDFRANLAAKRALIDEIKAFEVPADAEEARAASAAFAEKWNSIGFVPFKEKEAVGAAYKEAMQEKFPSFGQRQRREGGNRGEKRNAAPVTEKDRLMQQYNKLQQEIQTYENNIGFFGMSKGAESLKAQMQERIDNAKADLHTLMEKIRDLENKENKQEEESAE